MYFSDTLNGKAPSFSEHEKEILVRVARTLKSHQNELDRAWEAFVQGPSNEVTLLRQRHLREFIHYISAGDFKGWEEKLCSTVEGLRREKVSLSLGHSLHFCTTPSCLELLLKEFPRRQEWSGLLLALECFQNRNVQLALHRYHIPNGTSGNLSENRLTPREREVLRLVVQGLISKEIAVRLGISVKTVEVHRANLMKKLGLNNVAQLVSWAYQQEVSGTSEHPGS